MADSYLLCLKTLLYLSDCSEKNGCFQFMTNSSPQHIGIPSTSHQNKKKKRYYDNDIEYILNNYQDTYIINLCGNAGDLIIFDATYIHRGNIIQEGYRYALTNYPYKMN